MGNATEPAWPVWGSLNPAKAIRRRGDIYVGCVVFTCDGNRRVYYGGGRGNSNLSARHFYSPMEVFGETRVSWLVGYAYSPMKVPKRDPASVFGLDDVEDALWASTYRQRIGSAVLYCRDAEKLRQIASLIGWKP